MEKGLAQIEPIRLFILIMIIIWSTYWIVRGFLAGEWINEGLMATGLWIVSFLMFSKVQGIIGLIFSLLIFSIYSVFGLVFLISGITPFISRVSSDPSAIGMNVIISDVVPYLLYLGTVVLCFMSLREFFASGIIDSYLGAQEMVPVYVEEGIKPSKRPVRQEVDSGVHKPLTSTVTQFNYRSSSSIGTKPKANQVPEFGHISSRSSKNDGSRLSRNKIGISLILIGLTLLMATILWHQGMIPIHDDWSSKITSFLHLGSIGGVVGGKNPMEVRSEFDLTEPKQKAITILELQVDVSSKKDKRIVTILTYLADAESGLRLIGKKIKGELIYANGSSIDLAFLDDWDGRHEAIYEIRDNDPLGTWEIIVRFDGDDSYEGSFQRVRFQVGQISNAQGTIRAFIKDSNSNPLADVSVRLISSSTSEIDYRKVTDSYGFVEFDGLPAGQYMIRAEKIGYQSGSSSIVVNQGEAVTITLNLFSVQSRFWFTVEIVGLPPGHSTTLYIDGVNKGSFGSGLHQFYVAAGSHVVMVEEYIQNSSNGTKYRCASFSQTISSQTTVRFVYEQANA